MFIQVDEKKTKNHHVVSSEHSENIASLIAHDYPVPRKTESIQISKECRKRIDEYLHSIDETDQNLLDFWNKRGNEIIKLFKDCLSIPNSKALQVKSLNKKLNDCTILILSANTVEGTIVSRCLMELNNVDKLEKITADKQIYQFSHIGTNQIVHIWPQRTSSFTLNGSFNALRKALNRFHPSYVFSIGVAYGADPQKQQLGDVLIADHLVFYDSFNKVTNGTVKLNPDDVQIIGEDILGGCPATMQKDAPKKNHIGDFNWHRGTMLTGGSVISDSVEKKRLIEAAEKLSYEIIGGEMEGSGIFFGCTKDDGIIPFTIIKGICDWAIDKNGWAFITKEKEKQELIKNCIQAYACKNAFRALLYILDQISCDETDQNVDIANIQDNDQPDELTFTDYCNKAEYEQKRGNYQKAIIEWTNAIKRNPKSSKAYNNRGLCYADTKQYAKMLDDYNKAIELNPRNPAAYTNIAWYYEKEGKYDESIEMLNHAIEADPSYAIAYNNRGYIYFVIQKKTKAIMDLSKAIANDPLLATAYKNLGEVYCSTHDYQKAIYNLTKAIQIDPNMTVAYELRANAYFAIGEEGNAKSDRICATRLGK